MFLSIGQKREIRYPSDIVFTFYTVHKDFYPVILPTSSYSVTQTGVTVVQKKTKELLEEIDDAFLELPNYCPLNKYENKLFFALSSERRKKETLYLQLVSTGPTTKLKIAPLEFGDYLLRHFLVSELDLLTDIKSLLIEHVFHLTWRWMPGH